MKTSTTRNGKRIVIEWTFYPETAILFAYWLGCRGNREVARVTQSDDGFNVFITTARAKATFLRIPIGEMHPRHSVREVRAMAHVLYAGNGYIQSEATKESRK